MNHGLKLSDKTLTITLPDGTEVERVIVDGVEFVREEEEYERLFGDGTELFRAKRFKPTF